MATLAGPILASAITAYVYVHVALRPSSNLSLVPVSVVPRDVCSVDSAALERRTTVERAKLRVDQSDLTLRPNAKGEWTGAMRREAAPDPYVAYLLTISSDYIVESDARTHLERLKQEKLVDCSRAPKDRRHLKSVALDGEAFLVVARPSRYALIRRCTLFANGHPIDVELFGTTEVWGQVALKTVTVQDSQPLFFKYVPSMAGEDEVEGKEAEKALHELRLGQDTDKGCSVRIDCHVVLPSGSETTVAGRQVSLSRGKMREDEGAFRRLWARLWM